MASFLLANCRAYFGDKALYHCSVDFTEVFSRLIKSLIFPCQFVLKAACSESCGIKPPISTFHAKKTLIHGSESLIEIYDGYHNKSLIRISLKSTGNS